MVASKKIGFKAECESCDATGVYCGFAEAKGTGVVCINCDGTGCVELSYKQFIGRRRRKDVQMVFRSRGTFIATGVGKEGGGVPYEEFLNGKMPPKVR